MKKSCGILSMILAFSTVFLTSETVSQIKAPLSRPGAQRNSDTPLPLFRMKVKDEAVIMDAVRIEEMWPLIERFATLTRVSSDPDELTAIKYLVERLKKYEIPHKVHDVRLYLSIPRAARLVVDGEELPAKTPSNSASTKPEGLTAQLVYIPEESSSSGFTITDKLKAQVQGRVVMTEWPPISELVVPQLASAGAAAVLFVQPGERVHMDIVTGVWGSPDRQTMDGIPSIPVVMVSKSIGTKLFDFLKRSSKTLLTVHTKLDVGWKNTQLVVAEIPGTIWPKEFVLLHGHIDSWYEGIGDNATGDAAMLEVARIMWANRTELSRSLRIAWWPGHSTGRYAGSTWYADRYAQDILENCVAHLNCDSPGCRWATSFEKISSQIELGEFTQQAVLDLTGQKATVERPGRAGDYSFYNLGISSTMMLSSMIPESVRKEKHLYEVGGCGGNIEWHTEADTLAIADRNLLVRDTQLYALLAWRLANLRVHPIDYAATAKELIDFAKSYQEKSGGRYSFTPIFTEAESLVGQLSALYDLLGVRAEKLSNDRLAALNSIIRQVGRELVEIDYTAAGRFCQDPAQPLRPMPDLAWAEELGRLDPGSSLFYFTEHSLTRGCNRVMNALSNARELVSEARKIIGD